jgi:hypothetical protein
MQQVGNRYDGMAPRTTLALFSPPAPRASPLISGYTGRGNMYNTLLWAYLEF